MSIRIKHGVLSELIGALAGGAGGYAEGYNRQKDKTDEVNRQNDLLEIEQNHQIMQDISRLGDRYFQQKMLEKNRETDFNRQKELINDRMTSEYDQAIKLAQAKQAIAMGYDPKDQPEIDKIDRQVRELDNSMIVNPEYAAKTKQELLAKKATFQRIPNKTAEERINESSYFDKELNARVHVGPDGKLTVLAKKEAKAEKSVVDPQQKAMEERYWKRYFANLDAEDVKTSKPMFTPEQAHLKTSTEIGWAPPEITAQLKQGMQPQTTTQPAATQPATTQPAQGMQASFQGQPEQQEVPNFDGMREQLKKKAENLQTFFIEANKNPGGDAYQQAMQKYQQTYKQVQDEAKQVEASELSYYAETVTQSLPNDQRQMVVAKRDQLLQVIKQAEASQDLKTYQIAKQELQALMESLRQIGKGR